MNRKVVIIIGGAVLIIGLTFTAIYIFVTELNGGGQVSSCDKNSKRVSTDIVNSLSTRTPYISRLASAQQLIDPPSTGSCDVVHVWLVVRHGTRYPKKGFIRRSKQDVPKLRDKILNAYTHGRGQLCEEDKVTLTEWTPHNISESDEMKLTLQGELELEGLGQRFRQKYPSVFSKKYSNSSMTFRYTSTERAEASAYAFLRGSLGKEEASGIVLPQPINPDPVLRFYKSCKKWKKVVDNNPKSLEEQTEFVKSEYFEGLIQRMKERTGLLSDGDMNSDIVILLYDMCAYETAWSGGGRISPWCSFFNEEDMQILEYHQDLGYYWKDGYGNDINYRITCPTLEDLMLNLNRTLEDPDTKPSLVAYFSHSGLLLKFGALLGLFKDNAPLRHDNYDELKDRKWHSSAISKFATNLAVVLHKCENNHFKVQMLHQEADVPIPGCSTDNDDETNEDGHTCSLHSFLEHHKPSVDNCDVGEMCKL